MVAIVGVTRVVAMVAATIIVVVFVAVVVVISLIAMRSNSNGDCGGGIHGRSICRCKSDNS